MSEAKSAKPISRPNSRTAPKRVRRKESDTTASEATPKRKRTATKAKPKAKAKTKAKTKAEPASTAVAKPISLEASVRYAMIADAAYFRAEQRGFIPGHELEDWLAAERLIAQQHPPISA
jgi:hypothetical protein